MYRGADKSLTQPGMKQATVTDMLFIIIIGGILIIFIYIYIITLASKEIFSTSNKIYREVGRAKDLSTPLHVQGC